MSIIETIEKQMMDKEIPEVNIGDTVVISQEIVEGKKKRIQKFEGLVIKQQNNNQRTSITLRKIVDKIGVEKSFKIYSPLVKNIEITRRGKVRRARLFYLRDRLGKSATRTKAAD